MSEVRESGWGGRWPGAGRRPGTRNKVHHPEARIRRDAADTVNVAVRAAADEHVTPLEYMLAVLADPTADEDRRDRMAIAAAPYVHAKLAMTAIAAKVETSTPCEGSDERGARLRKELAAAFEAVAVADLPTPVPVIDTSVAAIAAAVTVGEPIEGADLDAGHAE